MSWGVPERLVLGLLGVPKEEHVVINPRCLDFAIGTDLLDLGRINFLERWESHAAVKAFRGSDSNDDQSAAMLATSVAGYDAADVWQLT